MATFAFTIGTPPTDGYGNGQRTTFGGTWAIGDTWTVQFAADSGNFTVGLGDIGLVVPSCLLNFNDRVYAGNVDKVNFSAVSVATGWEEQDVGAGFFPFVAQYAEQDEVMALGRFQDKLVAFGQLNIQIWTTDADPNQFALSQSLSSLGTKAALSIQSLGTIDTLFLGHSGIRSLQAHQVTGKAFVDDLGTPVDALVQEKLGEATADELAAACSVIEQSTGAYWLFLLDTIFVLSYFPASKITAWSVFEATDSDGNEFVPDKFVNAGTQLYVRDDDGNLYLYGGSDGLTYDETVATVELPWLDAGNPVHNKRSKSFDLGIQGRWTLQAGMDPTTGSLETIHTAGSATAPDAGVDSTYDTLRVSYEAYGTHLKIKLVSAGTSTTVPCKLGELVWKYELANET